MTQQNFIAPRLADLDVVVGTQFIQLGQGQELGLFDFDEPLVALEVAGFQRHRRRILGHIGLDVAQAIGPRHAHPVIAVAHEVGIPQLEEFNRRQSLQRIQSRIDAHPAGFIGAGAGEKLPGKVLVAADAAHDVIEAHHLRPFFDALSRPQPSRHFVKVEQIHVFAAQTTQQVCQLRLGHFPSIALAGNDICM